MRADLYQRMRERTDAPAFKAVADFLEMFVVEDAEEPLRTALLAAYLLADFKAMKVERDQAVANLRWAVAYVPQPAREDEPCPQCSQIPHRNDCDYERCLAAALDCLREPAPSTPPLGSTPPAGATLSPTGHAFEHYVEGRNPKPERSGGEDGR